MRNKKVLESYELKKMVCNKAEIWMIEREFVEMFQKNNFLAFQYMKKLKYYNGVSLLEEQLSKQKPDSKEVIWYSS